MGVVMVAVVIVVIVGVAMAATFRRIVAGAGRGR